MLRILAVPNLGESSAAAAAAPGWVVFDTTPTLHSSATAQELPAVTHDRIVASEVPEAPEVHVAPGLPVTHTMTAGVAGGDGLAGAYPIHLLVFLMIIRTFYRFNYIQSQLIIILTIFHVALSTRRP